MGKTEQGVSFEGRQNYTTRRVYANIAALTVLIPGMALCYDSNNATAANRYQYVEKPSLDNIGDFAGVVAPGNTTTGPGWIYIIEFDGGILRGTTVYTDESIAEGDFLGPIPGSYAFGKCVVGAPLFRATETVDRSTTAGTVTGDFGGQLASHPQWQNRIIRFFDHFDGSKVISAPAVANAVADAGTYLLTGTTATAAFADSTGPEAAAALQAQGMVVLTPTTTTQANLTMNGEPFRLDSGKSAFFRGRFCLNDVTTGTTGAFLGLSITDTAFLASKPTDYIGFLVTNAVLAFEYVKDGATGVVTSGTLATLVADTFVEVAFLIRNRGAGGMSLTVWVNGVEATVTLTATEIVDNESLTLVIETKGAEAHILKVDRVEINNYV